MVANCGLHLHLVLQQVMEDGDQIHKVSEVWTCWWSPSRNSFAHLQTRKRIFFFFCTGIQIINAPGDMKCRSSPAAPWGREIKEDGLRRGECARMLLKNYTSISAPRQEAQSFFHTSTSGMRLPWWSRRGNEKHTTRRQGGRVKAAGRPIDAALTLWTLTP